MYNFLQFNYEFKNAKLLHKVSNKILSKKIKSILRLVMNQKLRFNFLLDCLNNYNIPLYFLINHSEANVIAIITNNQTQSIKGFLTTISFCIAL